MINKLVDCLAYVAHITSIFFSECYGLGQSLQLLVRCSELCKLFLLGIKLLLCDTLEVLELLFEADELVLGRPFCGKSLLLLALDRCFNLAYTLADSRQVLIKLVLVLRLVFLEVIQLGVEVFDGVLKGVCLRLHFLEQSCIVLYGHFNLTDTFLLTFSCILLGCYC